MLGRRAAQWSARPPMPPLARDRSMPLVSVRLHVAGPLAGVESRGWAALCDGFAKAVDVPPHLVSLQRARRVAERTAAPAAAGAAGAGLPRLRRDAPAVELEFELADGGAAAAASSLAVAAMLSTSEQRFGEQLGMPLLQMPRVRIELPPDPAAAKPQAAESLEAAAAPPATGAASPAARPVSAGEEVLFGDAMAVVLRHAKQTAALEVPPAPPALAELMRDGAAQRRLLALLQAVLSGVEARPPTPPPAPPAAPPPAAAWVAAACVTALVAAACVAAWVAPGGGALGAAALGLGGGALGLGGLGGRPRRGLLGSRPTASRDASRFIASCDASRFELGPPPPPPLAGGSGRFEPAACLAPPAGPASVSAELGPLLGCPPTAAEPALVGCVAPALGASCVRSSTSLGSPASRAWLAGGASSLVSADLAPGLGGLPSFFFGGGGTGSAEEEAEEGSARGGSA